MQCQKGLKSCYGSAIPVSGWEDKSPVSLEKRTVRESGHWKHFYLYRSETGADESAAKTVFCLEAPLALEKFHELVLFWGKFEVFRGYYQSFLLLFAAWQCSCLLPKDSCYYSRWSCAKEQNASEFGLDCLMPSLGAHPQPSANKSLLEAHSLESYLFLLAIDFEYREIVVQTDGLLSAKPENLLL